MTGNSMKGRTMSAKTTADVNEQVKLAAQAFLYGYALVYNLHEFRAFVTGNPRFSNDGAI
jgi:hypothetical protein